MSYDLGLYPVKDVTEDTEAVEVEHFTEGGTRPINGTTLAELNITYNYSKFYYLHIDKELGIRWLYGRKAKTCTDRLKFAVTALGTSRDQDYWKPTAGNAGHALSILLEWSKNNPEAYFYGD